MAGYSTTTGEGATAPLSVNPQMQSGIDPLEKSGIDSTVD